MRNRLRFVGLTDTGKVREHNEDTIAFDADIGLLVLADGMGGYNARKLWTDTEALNAEVQNPKTAVMYLALIPQFIDPAHGSTTAQGFTLGAVQITVSMIVNASIVLAAGTVAGFLAARPSWIKWQRRITGSLLGAVAILLAREVPQAARP